MNEIDRRLAEIKARCEAANKIADDFDIDTRDDDIDWLLKQVEHWYEESRAQACLLAEVEKGAVQVNDELCEGREAAQLAERYRAALERILEEPSSKGGILRRIAGNALADESEPEKKRYNIKDFEESDGER